MFKKGNKSKSSQQSGSRESVNSSGNMSGSSLEKEGKDRDKMLNHKIAFHAHFLGVVPDIHISHSTNRDSEAQLIDQVEEAQIEGTLPILAREEDKVIINISRYGIKVLDVTEQEVLQRHSLQAIAQLVHYDDGMGKHNVALKKGQVTKTIFQCYVFQCLSEVQAQDICQSVRKLFDNTVDDIGRFQTNFDV